VGQGNMGIKLQNFEICCSTMQLGVNNNENSAIVKGDECDITLVKFTSLILILD
jgi:hypothetical protein